MAWHAVIGTIGALCVFVAASAQPRTDAGAVSADPDATALHDAYENDWAYRVAPWKREDVESVVVEASGLGDDRREITTDPAPCARFRMRPRDVREFVARGKKVSKVGWLHETTWSPCHAIGRLRFRSGVNAQWVVQRHGAGYLVIAGRRHYLDCGRCRFVVMASR